MSPILVYVPRDLKTEKVLVEIGSYTGDLGIDCELDRRISDVQRYLVDSDTIYNLLCGNVPYHVYARDLVAARSGRMRYYVDDTLGKGDTLYVNDIRDIPGEVVAILMSRRRKTELSKIPALDFKKK